MAGEPWNRVNIPFPSALSVVRVRYSATTDVKVKTLLGKTENVLKLLRSEILQTEIRVLYELLYVLNNSFRGNKTFKVMKQVEQCINRLKDMKLDVVLQDLTVLCPNRILRELSLKAGDCDVPSQPMLEWLCLKVLGASQLMSRTMDRCSKAFILSRQHMRWEFVVMNMVITSMLSRLWVIFRGILANLSPLYQQLLELLGEVAQAKPMPYLTDFSLPGDLAQFLGPCDTFVVTKTSTSSLLAKEGKLKQLMRKKPVRSSNMGWERRGLEDLGVAVQRGPALDASMKPFLTVSRKSTKIKSLPQETEKEKTFENQVREAATFTDMVTHLEEMIPWYKSQKMEKKKRLLTFLRLKCQRMKCHEAAGYNVQRKLQTFRQEVCQAVSSRGSVRKTSPSSLVRRDFHLRTRFQFLKRRWKLCATGSCVKKKRPKTTEVCKLSQKSRRSLAVDEAAAAPPTDKDNHDDIDDIFASVGL
ncbi:nucleolus and neural progenitor protein [Aulostomus maculatus]